MGGDCGNDGSCAVGVRGEESRAEGEDAASSTAGFGFVDVARGGAIEVASESVVCVISEVAWESVAVTVS